MAVQIKTAQQAVEIVKDGDRIALGGFVGIVVPEALSYALGERFQQTGHPRDLSIYFSAGQGDGKERANNHLAQEGMVSMALGGHWGLVPKLQKLANENKLTGYNFPQGIIAHLLRDSAAGKPGTISQIGLGTFVDPRIEGGRINDITKKDLVSVIEIKGKEYLFYDRIDANVAFIRGTTADENGNVTMEEECLFGENLAIAQLVKNNGGHVVVQVKRIVKAGELDPQHVRIPGIFVDTLVIAEESQHMQTFAEQYNPAYCGHGEKVGREIKIRPLDAKKIIAKRAAMELKQGSILNYGIGAPEVIAEVTDEEGVTNLAFTRLIPVWYGDMYNIDLLGLKSAIPTEVGKLIAVWAVEGALIIGILSVMAFSFRTVIPRFIEGSKNAVAGSLLAAMNTASEYGFGGVIAALPGFIVVSNSLKSIPDPLINEAVAVTTLAGITGSASGGMSIALAAMADDFINAANAAGIPLEVLHRVASMASGGMDTLPHNGAVITLLAVTGLTHRQAYKDVFAITLIKSLAVLFVILVFYMTGIV